MQIEYVCNRCGTYGRAETKSDKWKKHLCGTCYKKVGNNFDHQLTAEEWRKVK